MSEYTARTCCGSQLGILRPGSKAHFMYHKIKSERRRKNKAARKARRANR